MTFLHLGIGSQELRPVGSHFTVYEQFLRQSLASADMVAICFEGLSVSYAELAERVEQLTYHLSAKGVRSGSLVGIHLPRSIEMIVSTLAVLKLGATFLPLDPTFPANRKRFIVENAAPVLCISESSVEGLDREQCLSPWSLEEIPESFSGDSPGCGEMAYVIYTSGSTGQPKGVAISNKSLMHFFDVVSQTLNLGSNERFLALTTFGFDISILELLLPLTIGGTCCLVSTQVSKDASLLSRAIKSFNPTVLQATPSSFEMLIDEGWSPEPSMQILCGGEVWSPSLYHKLSNASAVWNAYGPTEATIWTSLTKVDSSRDLTSHSSLPISRHFPGALLIALNSELQKTLVGGIGELYIGGEGLAIGYFKNEALTRQKFVNLKLDFEEPMRLYRTGDLVRVINEDEYSYVGRTDNQLKVRGFRMEAGDIEHHFLLHPSIERCIVDVYEDGKKKHLVAWYKEKSEEINQVRENSVQDWGQLYDETYRNSSGSLSDFDTSGWNSAYTGEPIPKDQMARWVNHTVERISDLDLDKVLEIGCGTGLIMFPLIRKGIDYTGVDLSASVIERHQQQITAQDLKKCRVFQTSAHQLEAIPYEFSCVDTVVLNSVIQYFPDKLYLDKVIQDCIARVEQGRIFIGDVIDLRLQDAYYSSVIRHQDINLERDNILLRIEHKRERENELFVDPEYFHNLAHKWPEVSGVELMPKLLDDSNELCSYRYDVVLHIATPSDKLSNESSIVWSPENNLHSCLKGGNDSYTITGYPRKNIWTDRCFLKGAHSEEHLQSHALMPEELKQLAYTYGYQLHTSLEMGTEDSAYLMTLCFTKTTIASPLVLSGAVSKKRTTNTPKSINTTDTLSATEVRSYAETVLPYYMCPDLYVHVDKLPLTPNGKVDRLALPAPLFQSRSDEQPVGEIEIFLAECWKQVLQLDFLVSRQDRFLEVGGQSLSATRISSEIKKKFGVFVNVSDLLRAPTIETQTLLIKERQTVNQTKLCSVEVGDYPLSSSQERLWLKASLDKNHGAYYVQEVFELKGLVNLDALKFAFNKLIQRHEILRTTYHLNDGQVVQRISAYEGRFELKEFDLTSDPQPSGALSSLLKRLHTEEIDCSRDLMFHANVIKQGEDEHLLAITYHHLAIDDWSLDLIHQELASFYNMALKRPGVSLDSLSLRYHDYAYWQRSSGHDELMVSETRYWKKQLHGIPLLHSLQTDYTRSPEQGSVGECVRIELDKEISSKFARLCQSQDATFFMGMNAMLSLLLHRFGCGEDVVIGAPIANREISDMSAVVGFFVNTIALRTSLHENLSFTELLAQCKETALGAYQHQQVPFDHLVEQLVSQRDKSFHPIFQVMLVVKTPLSLPDFYQLDISEQRHSIETCLFDLEVHVEEHKGKLRIEWLYDTELFKPSTISRMVESFEILLKQIINAPEKGIYNLECTSLSSVPNVRHLDTKPKTLMPEIFSLHVKQRPHAIALIDGEINCSYSELFQRAQQIRMQLQHEGVNSGDCVAISMPRSIDMIASVLGIWQANAAFLIIDSNSSPERIRYIIEDAAPALLLSADDSASSYAEQVKTISITSLNNRELYVEAGGEISHCSLAYINYTSGSTGKPKGVKVNHGGLASIIDEWSEVLSLSHQDRWLQMANAAFDVFIADICRAFSSGASLVICPDEAKIDPCKMLGLILSHNITIGDFVPATVRVLVDELRKRGDTLNSLRLMVIGSDKWHWSDYRSLVQVIRNDTQVLNCYGTTETTIDNTWFHLPASCPEIEGVIPIGQPYKNASTYVLDAHGNLCPIGVWGELYLGGACLSDGYVRPELNAGNFDDHILNEESVGKLYATGDIVRWNENNQLELQGRSDDQIKLRGYRIELEEIQVCLESVPTVSTAVLCFDESKQMIRAFLKVTSANHEAILRQVNEQLHQELPSYMHPTTKDIVESFPVTSNGKVDRKMLLAEFFHSHQRSNNRKLNEVEEQVATIWAEITKTCQSQVHANSSFFEIGGHSLLIYKCLPEIEKTFGVSLDARLFFELASLERVAVLIEKEQGEQRSLVEYNEEEIGFFI